MLEFVPDHGDVDLHAVRSNEAHDRDVRVEQFRLGVDPLVGIHAGRFLRQPEPKFCSVLALTGETNPALTSNASLAIKPRTEKFN